MVTDIMDTRQGDFKRMIRINRTKSFEAWLFSLTTKEQLKVEARLEKIENVGHFGDVKGRKAGLAELRWTNGWRVYFIKEGPYTILLLLGGHKNGQKKDIEKARLFIAKNANN